MAIEKVLYTAQATVSGGRDGKGASNDGRLSVNFSTPKELGGDGGEGTNPEQMFAAGYAACFLSALKLVSQRQKVTLNADPSITAEVGIGPQGEGFNIAVELKITLPGLGHETAQQLVEATHQVCPYSNATRGNVDVKLTLVD